MVPFLAIAITVQGEYYKIMIGLFGINGMDLFSPLRCTWNDLREERSRVNPKIGGYRFGLSHIRHASPIWTAILKLRRTFSSNMSYVVGSSIRLWLDPWSGSSPLVEKILNLQAHNQACLAVLKLRGTFSSNMSYVVGSSIRLWLDPWSGSSPLVEKFTRSFIFTLDPSISIAEAHAVDASRIFLGWNVSFSTFLSVEHLQELARELEYV
ncbi:hypothetical protein Cni_G16101 [Canna indica]|uniref:Uncharacterized protein n=1 Tax=Canna indica TaxID=4628 RepID=A0AAQ3KKI3_9LILI|nr:hypothetical protein Cni_G16101 [Canna indica]